MKLLVTELRRFWGRRITWGVAIAFGIIMVLAAVITYTQTDSPDTDTRQRASEEADRFTQDCIEAVTAELESGANFDDFIVENFESLPPEEFEQFLRENTCFADPRQFEQDNVFEAKVILGDVIPGDWSDVRPDTSEPEIFDFAGEEVRQAQAGLQGIVPSISVFFLVIAVMIGASFVGAEYKFGTVENLLLWEPRRTRVLLTKFAAGFVSSAVLTAAILAFASVLFSLVAATKGSTEGVDGRFWLDLVSTIGRASLTGGLFFILAMSIAVIARNTVASVVAILGWFVISNIVVELAARWFRQWELFTNATSFISEADTPRFEEIQNFQQLVYGHGYLTAGFLVVVWTAVFALAAIVVFNRRDVD